MTQSSFDYVIVGGGAAGAVLANRLSSRSTLQVALVEAGPDTPPGREPADILDAYPIVAYFNRSYHWQNLKVHLDDPRDASDEPRRYEQAKVMGGGTSINGQFAFRGLPWDFDDWDANGAKGWNWENVLPYFCKLENDLDYGDREYHGSSGPMPLRRISEADWSPFTNATATALRNSGVENIQDHNGCFGNGYFPMTINNIEGHRFSTARAYLTNEVRGRDNLEIFSETEMREILFDNGKATGVRLRSGKAQFELTAGEIIVCAGALQTPAILMRSGIGEAEHLKKQGIRVRSDRPGVGQNLQDHPMVALAAYLPRASRLPASMRRHIQMGYRYTSDVAGTPKGDMFILPSNRAAWHPLGRRLASILVCVNKPYSRGEIRLTGPSAEDPAFINFRQLSDERDVRRLEDGMKRLWGIISDPAMAGVVENIFPATFSERVRKLGAVSQKNWFLTAIAAGIMGTGKISRKLMIERVITPNTNVRSLMNSSNALREWIFENACGSWHASGTCRMGQPDQSMAVVDPQGMVMGVGNLRVVDASIMPSVISGNTMLTTIMSAEKIADEILVKS